MKHILFTNNTLDKLAGSELYIYDLACEYQKRGYQVTCFTLKPGRISDRLAQFGIRTTNDLSSVTGVDIIHSHHRLEFKIAAAYFPHVPLVHGSLGPTHPFERPAGGKAIITRHLVISRLVRRIIIEHEGVSENKIDVVTNFVDLKRFTATSRIHDKPKRVLLLSNYFQQDEVIREACELGGGLEFTWVGEGSTSVWEVEKYIEQADIVIAKGQGALQAMAMGRAVIVFGPIYSDGLITPENFEAMTACNFNGMTSMLDRDVAPKIMDSAQLAGELKKYDRAGAEALMVKVREEFKVERVADKLLNIYGQAIHQFKAEWAGKPQARLEAVSRELGEYLIFLKDADDNREDIAPLKSGYVKLEKAYLELEEIHNRNIVELTRLEDQLKQLKGLLERISAGRVMKALNFFNNRPGKRKPFK